MKTFLLQQVVTKNDAALWPFIVIKPNTHRRRRRDETVLSRRRRRCVHEFATSSRRLPTDSVM